MQIYGPAHLHGSQGVNAPHGARNSNPSGPPATNRPGDQLELSEAGQIAAQLADVNNIRNDRVAEIREAIAAGTYESDEKLSIALDRLLNEIT